MTHTTRRTFIGGSLALGTALALPGRALALTSTASSGSFFQSMGVNAQVWYANNAWPQRLVELGVPHVRLNCHQNKEFIAKIGPWLATGGRINSIIYTDKTLEKAVATKNLDFLKNYVGLRHISGIEGPNEINNYASTLPNWGALLNEYVRWTHATVRSDSAFGHIPLIAPSIAWLRPADYAALGDVSPYVDKGNIHFYSGWNRPTVGGLGTMQSSLKDASVIAPGRSIWLTESGWQAPSGTAPLTLRAQAKYILRNYFDAFGCGVEKLFTFQLMDNTSKLHGLCDSNANPKPSFFALKNLAALFKDSASGAKPLAYTVSNAPTSLKVFTFSKSDGSFLLAFYLDVNSFDKATRKDVETQMPVMFNLPASARRIEAYQPTFKPNSQLSTSGREVALFASDEVTVLQIWF